MLHTCLLVFRVLFCGGWLWTMQVRGSMARLCLLVLLGAVTGVLSLNDYWNHFCGKQNCYELLSVPEVSTWLHIMAGRDGMPGGGN